MKKTFSMALVGAAALAMSACAPEAEEVVEDGGDEMAAEAEPMAEDTDAMADEGAAAMEETTEGMDEGESAVEEEVDDPEESTNNPIGPRRN